MGDAASSGTAGPLPLTHKDPRSSAWGDEGMGVGPRTGSIDVLDAVRHAAAGAHSHAGEYAALQQQAQAPGASGTGVAQDSEEDEGSDGDGSGGKPQGAAVHSSVQRAFEMVSDANIVSHACNCKRFGRGLAILHSVCPLVTQQQQLGMTPQLPVPAPEVTALHPVFPFIQAAEVTRQIATTHSHTPPKL